MKKIFKYMDARIFSYYHEAEKIMKGVMPLPRMLNFMPAALCNHNCYGCDFSSINKTRYLMHSEDWKAIFRQLSRLNSIKFIEFGGLGEPMLHPDIHEMVKAAGRQGWIIGILTNGTRLKGEVLEDLIRNGAYIRISMESGSKKVFDKIKKPQTEEDGFEAVCRNIKGAVRLRHGINPSCNINYKFAVGRENHKDIEQAILLATGLGCDSIQFKTYRNTPSELDDFQKGIINSELGKLKRRYGHEIVITGRLTKTLMETRCFMAPIHVLVDAYGDVYNCCYFRHRMSSLKIGNIIREGFDKIWDSARHWEVLKNIKKEECELYDCKYFRYNKVMEEFMSSRELDTI